MQEYIGTYEIVDYLGAGGMATVYKAYQPKLGRHVAIKVLHPIYAQDREFLARFEREARIIARLDHPHIVPIYDYDEYEGKPYLVIKYIEGQTLKEILKEEILSLEVIRTIMVKVADALTYAHQEGILHRDFKPSNIMIDPNAIPCLMDFGLARIAQQGESTLSTDTILGTPQYISPEQAQGLSGVDARTDVYALGIILYQLVVGRVPFVGESAYAIVHKQIYAVPPLPSELNPELPDAVDKVLMRALEKDPQKRYTTPNSLIQAFENAVITTGLKNLDEDRVSTAVKYGEKLAEYTPGGAFIPTPFGDVDVDHFVHNLGTRFRDAVMDIKQQLQEGKFLEKIAKGAHQVAIEFGDEAVSTDSGHGFGQQIGDRFREWRGRRMMEFDWSDDPSLVRKRIRRRTNQRRGFFVHLLFYVFMITLLYSVTPDIQQALNNWFLDPGFIEAVGIDFTPFASLPIWGVIALFWASGLASHAIEVAYNVDPNVTRKRRTLRGELEALYGPKWQDHIDGKDYQQMRNRVDERYRQRINLIQHFFSVIISFWGIALLWAPIYQILSSEDVQFFGLLQDIAIIPLIILLFMILSIFIHVLMMIIGVAIGAGPHETAIRREIEREREVMALAGRAYAKTKRDHTVLHELEKAKNNNRSSASIGMQNKFPRVRLNTDGELT